MSAKKMNAKRLLKLADFLETVPRKKFYYGSWATSENGRPNALTDCGTTACAMGWATTIPSFKRLGLRLEWMWGRTAELRLNDSWGVQAAAELFGITEDQAQYLFIPGVSGLSASSTPKQVARHIRKFVRDHQ